MRRKHPQAAVKIDEELPSEALQDDTADIIIDQPHLDAEDESVSLFQELTKEKQTKEVDHTQTAPHTIPFATTSEILEPAAEEYLRRKVNQELYGTDEPTKHDRTLAALRERAFKYGR